ncbi:hypothetical protein HAX54_052391 [Datura stramonium]|uniref:Ubiquitin conjugation factor E4 core domain-containing protein n=1 Tax=Datura stramonium TaxID=4076 RepID=A0ABS8WSA3_DATST|nr:hypothetical protein [Datura stramonium]
MLRLCEPFLDANLTKRDKIDPQYVFSSTRLELRGVTALHASPEEVRNWDLEKGNTKLYLVKEGCLEPYGTVDEWLIDMNKHPRHSCSRKYLAWKKNLSCIHRRNYAMKPKYYDEASQRALSLTDAMELLIFASNLRALDGVLLDDFMNFIIMFMASPEYIRNPYLRSKKMVEVLNCWMPREKVPTRSSMINLISATTLLNYLNIFGKCQVTGMHGDSGMGAKTSSRKAGENPAVPFTKNIIRIDMKLANEDVSLLAFTSEQITVPFSSS